MPRKPGSNSGEAPAWLEEQVYGPKRQRTVGLVRQAADALVAAGQRVSMASVAAKSREIDPEGLGVSESSILVNRAAHAYYDQHRTWKYPQSRRPPATGSPSAPAPVQVKADRNVGPVRQRYLRMSKQKLVDRLVAVEQAYAAQEERWLRANDKLLAAQLQAEQADLDPQAMPTGPRQKAAAGRPGGSGCTGAWRACGGLWTPRRPRFGACAGNSEKCTPRHWAPASPTATYTRLCRRLWSAQRRRSAAWPTSGLRCSSVGT